MEPKPCTHELQSLAAARDGNASPTLLRHLGSCETCAASTRLAQGLASEAHALAATFPNRDLPSASLLWRRHQLARKRAATLRALRRPTRIVTALAAVYLLSLTLWTASTLRSPLRASVGHTTLHIAGLHINDLLFPGALLTLLLLASAAATFLATSRPLPQNP